MTMGYEKHIFWTNRHLKWISASITNYIDLVWQSKLMTCKTTTRNLTCITEFSLSICQYLVLQVFTIKPLRPPSNFRFPDQHLLVPRPAYISHPLRVSAVLTKNLLCNIQTLKKYFCLCYSSAKNTTYHRISEICKVTTMSLCLFQHVTSTSLCLLYTK